MCRLLCDAARSRNEICSVSMRRAEHATSCLHPSMRHSWHVLHTKQLTDIGTQCAAGGKELRQAIISLQVGPFNEMPRS